MCLRVQALGLPDSVRCGFMSTRHLEIYFTEFFVMQSFPKFTLIQPPTKTARQMEGEGNASRAVKPTGTHMSRLSASMRSLVIFLGYVVLRSCKQS